MNQQLIPANGNRLAPLQSELGEERHQVATNEEALQLALSLLAQQQPQPTSNAQALQEIVRQLLATQQTQSAPQQMPVQLRTASLDIAQVVRELKPGETVSIRLIED